VQTPDFSQNFNRYSYVFNNPLKYTDPTGEYALIDDLIVAVIGGVVNVVVNAIQGNVNSWGQGFALFGVGAGGAWAGLYTGPAVAGMIIGGGNSFVNQGFGNNGNWNWGNISGQQILFDGIMGGVTGQLGASLGQAISPYVSNLTSGIGGQAVQQALTQSITGSSVGFTMGTGFSLLNGESWNDALKAGGQGALMGFGIGATTGLATGMRSGYKAGENPWTGRSLNSRGNDVTLYRAVSPEEFADIQQNGIRVNPDGTGYQHEKLFYKSYEDAVTNTRAYDAAYGQKSIIIKIQGPNAPIYNNGYMDGFNVISINSEYLYLLNLAK
jgi:hypothetical protein